MNSKPGAARVLVASDKHEDAQQILRQLSSDFDHVRASTDPDRAVQDVEEWQPDVLVLAFDSLDKAQRYYLGLYRLGQTLQQHRHRTVILCGKDEVRAVFELCKKQYFDDYVLYWPHAHDGPRLLMSVWAACREMAAPVSDAPRTAELLTHAKHLGDLESALDRGFAAGERQGGAWVRGFRDGVEPALKGTRALAEKVRGIRPVVMVVEDDEFARQLIQRLLDPREHELLMAANGEEALGQLRRVRPDLVLMDINLPGMDGLALTRRLKASPHLADIPVVMMTGDARRETLVSSMEAGAAAFVVKPFTRESLMAKLDKILPR